MNRKNYKYMSNFFFKALKTLIGTFVGGKSMIECFKKKGKSDVAFHFDLAHRVR